MSVTLSDPIFHSEDAARAHLESIRWPDGPICPHCGNADADQITTLKGKSHRPGLNQCNECRQHFTVTVGTVMERSHIPLHKWVAGFHLMNASKKGVSAHQLHRMLGITYKSAWFMAHRIREAMTDGSPAPMGGEGSHVQADETNYGNTSKRSKRARANNGSTQGLRKETVVALVDPDKGHARAFHVKGVSAQDVREILVTNVSRDSTLVSDESKLYTKVGAEFAAHETGCFTNCDLGFAKPAHISGTVRATRSAG